MISYKTYKISYIKLYKVISQLDQNYNKLLKAKQDTERREHIMKMTYEMKKERIGRSAYPLNRKENIPFLELDSSSCFFKSSISF